MNTALNDFARRMERQFVPDKGVATWLFICCGVIFCIVMIGGATRLTRSGLSIVRSRQPAPPVLRGVMRSASPRLCQVHWKFTGEKPPMNDEEWKQEFERYKLFPEFKL